MCYQRKPELFFFFEMAIQNAAHGAQDYFLYQSSTEITYVIVIFYCDVKYVYTDGRPFSR